MKKLLFALLAWSAACCVGCSDDGPDCPVKGVVLPESSATAPIRPGTSVAIRGDGFAADCEIWLRGSTEVQAEITAVSSNSLTFVAPAVYGRQQVVLRQDGGSWVLGTLEFPEASAIELLPRKIVRIVERDIENGLPVSEWETTYRYDDQGRLIGESGGSRSIVYEARRIVVEDSDARSILELDNGRAVRIAVTETDDYTYASDLHYDDDGYLHRLDYNEDEYRYTQTVSVIEGDLAAYEIKDNEGGRIEKQFTYGTALNNLNLDLFALDVQVDEECEFDLALLLGAGGNRFRRLPTSCTCKVYEDGRLDDSYTISMAYVMEGAYIKKIRFSTDGEVDYEWELFYEE